MTVTVRSSELPKASFPDSFAFLSRLVMPTLAKGVIIRRPRMVAFAERRDLDASAVRLMQRLEERYRPGPLLLGNPVRPQAVILDPQHVNRILGTSPEPFATRSSEKRAALAHFEPKGALISHGDRRGERRRFNEEVLDMERPMHRLAERFLRVADEEAQAVVRAGEDAGVLEWDAFADAWFRLVRRVVFGDMARDDHRLGAMLSTLRADANWAFLKPKRRRLRARFFDRMRPYLEHPEEGSLAAVMAATHAEDVTAPEQQVPQWLFAFDPAGMNTFRSLALLASHPEQEGRARQEIEASGDSPELPYLRACALEGLRLWPTTPLLLRQSTEETHWEQGRMPAGTGILIYAPFFHRDERHLDYAHRFEPGVWLRERHAGDWPLIPFSGGPARCPGQNLVLMLTSAMLAALLRRRRYELLPAERLDPGRPLPGTLDNYGLRFRLRA